MTNKSNILSPGVKMMVISTIGFSAMSLLIKELSLIPVSQIVFFRSGITALYCMFVLRVRRVSYRGNRQKLLVLRAICGIISMTMFFVTVQRIPLGAAVSLKYLSPLFTAFFAYYVLKEHLIPRQFLYFGMAFLGVLMLKGFDARIDTLNLCLGIVGAFFGGLVYVIIRKIGTSENSLVIVNHFMLSATILAGLFMIFEWKSPSLREWILLISMGAAGSLGQIFMTKAFQIEAANRIAPLKYLELVFALILGFTFFGEIYTILSFLGIFLIVCGMLLNLLVKSE